jgi:hypothetical protein
VPQQILRARRRTRSLCVQYEYATGTDLIFEKKTLFLVLCEHEWFHVMTCAGFLISVPGINSPHTQHTTASINDSSESGCS